MRNKIYISGFTLIELIVVIGIIGILTAVGVPMYNGYVASAKAKAAQSQLQSIFLLQKNYYSANYCYYITSNAAGDYATNINQNLMGSNSPTLGPIPVGGKDGYNFYITGTTGSSCTGNNANDYVAYAQSTLDASLIFSINQDGLKVGF